MVMLSSTTVSNALEFVRYSASMCTFFFFFQIFTRSFVQSPDGHKKSGRYWPDDEAAYGNVNVKHMESESCPYYTRREFYVNNVKSDENLVLTQFQYNGWPTVEGEVPQVTRGLIELMDHATTLNENTNSSGPILVHCELGGDRSSMFVALCILAQQLKVERRVDVVTTTRKLRSQRQGMLTSFVSISVYKV